MRKCYKRKEELGEEKDTYMYTRVQTHAINKITKGRALIY